MALDLTNIEMGMKNGASAVNNNFKSIEKEMNIPQIKTQSIKADNDSQWSTNQGRVTKQGRIVTVQFRGYFASDSNSTTAPSITLPSWAKPMEMVEDAAYDVGEDNRSQTASRVQVTTDGLIGVYTLIQSTGTQFTITYVSAS